MAESERQRWLHELADQVVADYGGVPVMELPFGATEFRAIRKPDYPLPCTEFWFQATFPDQVMVTSRPYSAGLQ